MSAIIIACSDIMVEATLRNWGQDGDTWEEMGI